MRANWLLSMLTAFGLLDWATASLADDAEWKPETIVYKTVGPTKIEADVYRSTGNDARPTIVWIHGGALIMGGRQGVPGNILKLARERNYVVISLDYRLAPEVRLPAIIEDIQDAFRWIHAQAAPLHVDPSRILVSGGSAGGYLTMMTGICVEPRPRALVAYYGYGDIDGPWYIEPSAHYRQQPLVTREDALKVVGGEVKTGSDGRPRGTYYLYLRQNGLWAQEVSGFNPRTEPRKFDPYCPVRNITPQYPPILMLHGTADTDVPYQESADMDAALAKQGVEHELITVVGAGHGLGDRNDPATKDAHTRAIAFMRKHLESAP
jgi:acetyl esterase/lipase